LIRAIVKLLAQIGKQLDELPRADDDVAVSDRANDTRLVDRRRGNTGRLLSVLAIDFQRRVLGRLHSRGYEDLRLAHNAVLMNIDLNGTRLTAIARRSGITRQAVGQLVDDLESLQYVLRRPDPHDGRAQLVEFTPRGRRMLADAIDEIDTVETEYGATFNADRSIDLASTLERVARGLDVEIP
jgi:DNA-binding MarR family transcriptional regulator